MPISLLFDGQVTPPSRPQYARRKDREIRHESLWSLSHRFCALNIISGEEFRREFLLPKSQWEGRGGFLVGASGGAFDLREFGSLNTERLAEALGRRVMHEAIGGLYEGLHHETRIWPYTAAPHLRYCPQCMAWGVHMFFQQFECVGHCPVHGHRLRTVCPGCKECVPYSPPLRGRAFHCNCGYNLRDREETEGWRVPERLITALSRSGDWFSGRIHDHRRHHLKIGCSVQLPWKFNSTPLQIEYPWATNYRLTTLWAVLQPRFGSLDHNFDAALAARTEFRSVSIPRGRRMRTWEGQDNYRGRNPLARATYKAICRHFYRHILRRHRASLRAIASKPHDYHAVRPRGVRLDSLFDPVAQAFAVWKCYWEWRYPEELYGGSQRNQVTWKWQRLECERFDERQDLAFENSRLTDSQKAWLEDDIYTRFVALRCLGTFEECLARIEAVRRTRSVDYLPVNMIDQRHVPSMSVELQEDENVRLTIFWPAKRWLHSETFAQWVRSVPKKSAVSDYAAGLNKRIGKWNTFQRFKWPKEKPESQYFLQGASIMEDDADYSVA